VAGFVTVIYVIVIALLARFSEHVVFDESIETTQQALENTALRIDNSLRQADMTAFLEHQTFTADKMYIERLIRDNSYFVSLNQFLPNAQFFVSDKGAPEQKPGYFVFAEPIYNNRFHLVIVCPNDDIYGKYEAVKIFLFVTGLTGLLLIIFFCWKVIARHLWPLHLLADSAELIADGNLDVRIPDSGMKNEIGQLQNSFATMQMSLATYMDEMRQKQVMLGRQNTELENAYSHAKDYDKLKNKFLSNMTDQMVKPIDNICELTDKVCDQYESMNQSEMEKILPQMVASTDKVTHLLEQLLDVPSKKYTAL
jgi:methyl-accepting chemotaxis protein